MKGLYSDTCSATREMAIGLGLSFNEYLIICRKLERNPNYAELGILSAMFSEHCSYKSSKQLLKKLLTTGDRVLQGPGENAGVVDIGHGWAVAFKMESHNHPSFIEPYQGAATGVGGILRDIFTMGARPIVSMNGLCFGSPDLESNRIIVRGVVKGIGNYGNSVGVPMVAGQTLFHPTYNKNPLVNAFTLGLVRKDRIFRGTASGPGNLVVYVGAKTGRDGVHGATMASQEFSSDTELERPAVQVGDPFTEKLLLEATLEAMAQGLMVGIQDMGAAGLTSSSFEMADRAGTGLVINLDRIPTRETGLSAYELLLSESQERMLLVTTPENFEGLSSVYEKWDLHAEAIGEVVEGSRVLMSFKGETVVDLPVELVTHPPPSERTSQPPSDMQLHLFLDRNKLYAESVVAKFRTVFESINFANPRPLIQQYDSMVGIRTMGEAFADAAVIRIREIEDSPVKLAMTLDCNPRICSLWPREGARRTIAESSINLASMGANPIGATDCLNFGSPENPLVMWQLEEVIEGLSESCTALKIPIVSGNVSLYNDTDSQSIYPSPMIGMVGLIEGEQKLPISFISSTASEVALVGKREGGLGGSVLASQWFKRECGKPDPTDLREVQRAIQFCIKLNKSKLNYSIHDISDGGLVIAALEMVLNSPMGELGIEISIPRDSDVDGFLFGESVPRILIAYDPDDRTRLENLAGSFGIPFYPIGNANTQGRVTILQGSAKLLDEEMNPLKIKWESKWNTLFLEGV